MALSLPIEALAAAAGQAPPPSLMRHGAVFVNTKFV